MASEAVQAGLFCLIFFFVGFNSGYPSTFFPVFAQEHGYTMTEVGIFISTYSLFGCVFSFFGPSIVNKLGSRLTLALGIIFAFGTNFVLALMYFWVDDNIFLPVSVLCRGALGGGASFIYIIGYSFSLKTSNTTRYVVAFETLYGLGIAFGPVFSANAFQMFGYVTCFCVLGVIGVCLLPVVFLLDFHDAKANSGSVQVSHGGNEVDLPYILKYPGVQFVAWLLMIAWAGMFYIQPIWQSYVKLIGGEVWRVELSFAVISIGYLVGGPSLLIAFGLMKIHNVMALGMFLTGVAMTSMFIDNIAVQVLASFFTGFGIAFLSMPTIQMSDLCLPAHVNAHVAISSLFSLFSYVGGFFGPTMAAIIYSWDPVMSFITIGMIHLITFVAWMTFTPSYRDPKKDDSGISESTPLLMAPPSPNPGGVFPSPHKRISQLAVSDHFLPALDGGASPQHIESP